MKYLIYDPLHNSWMSRPQRTTEKRSWRRWVPEDRMFWFDYEEALFHLSDTMISDVVLVDEEEVQDIMTMENL